MKGTNRRLITAFILFFYVIVIGGYLTWWNESEGGLVQGWYREYVGEDGHLSGSGKWRVHGDFRFFALFFGTFVYPFSLIAAFLFLLELKRAPEKMEKIILISCAAIALAITGYFLCIGLFRAVSPF
jgi:hypothetical protein